MLLIIGIILGAVIGYKFNDLIKKLNNGIHFKFFGYDIYIGKESFKRSPKIVEMNKKENVPIKEKTPVKENKKCELCYDENMYIKGTKNLIPCPKCKRNANKFKSPAN